MSERARTGETFRDAINRLLRRSARAVKTPRPTLPILPGRPRLDVTDWSEVLAALDGQRRAQRGLP